MDDAALLHSLADSLEWALDTRRDYHIGANRTVEWARHEDERNRKARELVKLVKERELEQVK